VDYPHFPTPEGIIVSDEPHFQKKDNALLSGNKAIGLFFQ